MRGWKVGLGRVAELLGLYLEDLLMASGCVCLTAASALRWGAAAGLATGGICLIGLSIVVARSGRR